MYFFYRWHITNEGFPCFTTNKHWFDLKIAKGVQTNRPLTYSSQLNAINRAFKACHISSSKKTHAGRGSGARHAEIDGATEDQLRRHGRWNMQSMEACYLNSLPRKSIRIINGFPEEKGHYWLPRSDICPPESLQKKIFPKAEHLLFQVNSGDCETSICAQAFLQLLIKMRKIILQDAVMFRADHSGSSFIRHHFFCHPIFQDAEFLAFERLLLSHCGTAQVGAQFLFAF
jgi:hypothetical protein